LLKYFGGLGDFGKKIQIEILERLLENCEKDEAELIPLLLNYVEKINSDDLIKSGKLAQISRQGFDTWYQSFRSKSKEMSKKYVDIYISLCYDDWST
jgi:hypothetical protein